MANRPLNVQTPGAAGSVPSAPDDGGEGREKTTPNGGEPRSELPPDLQAIVAAEVARQVGLQRAANKPATTKAGEPAVPYAEAEAKMLAMSPQERRTMRPILTDKGYLVSPEYGASTRATLE